MLLLIFTAGGRFPWACANPLREQSSCGVSACTLIPQESPPAVTVNKEKSRKSTAKDYRANILENNLNLSQKQQSLRTEP